MTELTFINLKATDFELSLTAKVERNSGKGEKMPANLAKNVERIGLFTPSADGHH